MKNLRSIQWFILILCILSSFAIYSKNEYPKIVSYSSSKSYIDIGVDPAKVRFNIIILKNDRILYKYYSVQGKFNTVLIFEKYLLKKKIILRIKYSDFIDVDLCQKGFIYLANNKLTKMNDWGDKVWERDLEEDYTKTLCTRNGFFLISPKKDEIRFYYDANPTHSLDLEVPQLRSLCPDWNASCKIMGFPDFSDDLVIMNRLKRIGFWIRHDSLNQKLDIKRFELDEYFKTLKKDRKNYLSFYPMIWKTGKYILVVYTQVTQQKLADYIKKYEHAMDKNQKEVFERMLWNDPEAPVYIVKNTYWLVQDDGSIVRQFEVPEGVGGAMAISSDTTGKKLIFLNRSPIGGKRNKLVIISFKMMDS